MRYTNLLTYLLTHPDLTASQFLKGDSPPLRQVIRRTWVRLRYAVISHQLFLRCLLVLFPLSAPITLST